MARNPPGTAGNGGASTRAPTNRSWPAAEAAAGLERVFVVGPLPPSPPRPLPPFDPSVCELGEASTPANGGEADSGQGSQADAASSVADAGTTTSFELPELGRPCGDGCPTTSCYESTSGNPICTRPCTAHAECGSTGVCQAIDRPGQSLCFRRCQSDSECLAINASGTPGFDPTLKPDAGNPLVCRATKDPRDHYFGNALDGDPNVCHRLCVQSSEP